MLMIGIRQFFTCQNFPNPDSSKFSTVKILRHTVADNKMPQQMAFHGVVCCLHRCQIVICLWYVRQPINLPQA